MRIFCVFQGNIYLAVADPGFPIEGRQNPDTPVSKNYVVGYKAKTVGFFI